MNLFRRALSFLPAFSGPSAGAEQPAEGAGPADLRVQSVLLSIFRSAATHETVRELFADIRLELGQLIDTSNLFVALYNANTSQYTFPYHVDTHESTPQQPLALSGSLTDYVRRTGEPLLVDEALHEELIRQGEADLVGAPSPTWMGAPLEVNGETIGVVVVQAYEDGNLYSQEDLEILTFLAENIALLVQRRRVVQELRASERRFRDLFEASPDGVFVEDLDGNVLDVNPAACELQGIERERLVGMNVSELVPVATKKEALRNFQRLASGKIGRLEGSTLTGDGRTVPVEVRAQGFEYSGKPALLIQVRDITRRKEYERQLEHLARFDALTGLANRVLFEDRLQRAVLAARRDGGQIALLYLDLDKFKNVNDTLGHLVGDELLKMVADRLAAQVRGTDSVARLGGDEFAIIQVGADTATGVSALAARALESLSKPFVVSGHQIHASTSIGISLSSPEDEPGDLMLQADQALYRAKALGRGNFQFHDEALAEEVDRYVSLKHDLESAIQRNEFFLEYQPQVNLATGEIVGCEALVRWQHPERGLLYPDAFLPVAENTSLIVALGSWVLEETCRQHRQWSDRNLPEIFVAVDISVVQLRDPQFIKHLDKLLSEFGMPAHLLELELTETVLMQGSEGVRETIRDLSERGVSFAIDDFGTGYSSLRHLRESPVGKLKIAMEFVQGAPTDLDDAAIVEAVISLGHKLGLTVIAEGVETSAQIAFLRQHGCDEGQGFYFGRPVSAGEFTALLKTL